MSGSRGFIEGTRRSGSGLRVAIRAGDIVMVSENHDRTVAITLRNREVVCLDLTYDDVEAQIGLVALDDEAPF